MLLNLNMFILIFALLGFLSQSAISNSKPITRAPMDRKNIDRLCSKNGPLREKDGIHCTNPSVGFWVNTFCSEDIAKSACQENASLYTNKLFTSRHTGKEKNLADIKKIQISIKNAVELEKTINEQNLSDVQQNKVQELIKGYQKGKTNEAYQDVYAKIKKRTDFYDRIENRTKLCRYSGPIRDVFDSPERTSAFHQMFNKKKVTMNTTLGRLLWAEEYCKGLAGYDDSRFHNIVKEHLNKLETSLDDRLKKFKTQVSNQYAKYSFGDFVKKAFDGQEKSVKEIDAKGLKIYNKNKAAYVLLGKNDYEKANNLASFNETVVLYKQTIVRQ